MIEQRWIPVSEQHLGDAVVRYILNGSPLKLQYRQQEEGFGGMNYLSEMVWSEWQDVLVEYEENTPK